MFAAYKKMFQNWNNFHGRTSRRDYWLAFLANFIVALILGAIIGVLTVVGSLISEDLGAILGGLGSLITGLYSLILIVPGLSMSIRRFHDTGKTTGFFLLCWLGSICCGIGSIVAFVIEVLPGTPGPNQFGPDPNGFNGNGMGYGQPNMNYGQPNMNQNQYNNWN